MDLSTDGRKLVAEFVGTFTLIFVGAGSIILTGGGNLVAIGLAHGLAIALMVSALGHISGGHFNPAVTVGFWATQRIDTPRAVAYIAVQLLGATVGALVLLVFPEALREAVSLGTPLLGEQTDFGQGVLIEGLLTFFLMTVIFGTAVAAGGPNLGGIAIGLTITMDIFAGGRLTGAAMNPARSFGPALVNGTWDDHIVYWIGPIIGAVVAALLYHYVFMDEQERAGAGA